MNSGVLPAEFSDSLRGVKESPVKDAKFTNASNIQNCNVQQQWKLKSSMILNKIWGSSKKTTSKCANNTGHSYY